MFPIANADGDDDASPVGYFRVVFTSEPADAVGVIGGQAAFHFTFISGNPALVSLFWQIQTDGATWGDLVETPGYYEGVATTTLTVKAIDNFLADGTSLNFRCRAVYANSVAFITRTAVLDVPLFTTWYPIYTAKGSAQTGQPCAIRGLGGPNVVGMLGPISRQWARIGGSAAFVGSGLTSQEPTWNIAATAAGLTLSIWQLTFTNGTDTVTSDPLYLFTYGVAAPSDDEAFATAPLESADGAALAVNAFMNFAGPWLIGLQNNFRRGATAAVTIDTPAASPTTFSLNGPAIPGTAVCVFVTAEGDEVGANAVSLGVTSWQR